MRGYAARLLLSLAVLAGAAASAAVPVRADVGVSVGPSLIELKADPGGEGRQELTVTNSGDEAFEAAATVESYRGADGEFSAVDWVTVEPAAFRLEPGQQQRLTVTITVPRDLESGGRYAMVAITPGAQETEGTGAAVTGKLGVPFLIAVDGEGKLTEEATLERFAPTLEPDGRIGFRALVRNEGNLHVVAQGAVEISDGDGDPFGRLDIPRTTSILPGSVQTVIAFGSLPLDAGGEFTAATEIDYGGKKPLKAETAFTVAPSLAVEGLGICENLDRGPTLRATLRNDGDLGLEPGVEFAIEDASGQPVQGTAATQPAFVWPDATAEIAVDFPQRLLSGDYVLIARARYGMDGEIEQRWPFAIGGTGENVAPLCGAG
ncbi:MAG: fimbrial biogenesis chaperone [Thermomicrobiales bacterium]